MSYFSQRLPVGLSVSDLWEIRKPLLIIPHAIFPSTRRDLISFFLTPLQLPTDQAPISVVFGDRRLPKPHTVLSKTSLVGKVRNSLSQQPNSKIQSLYMAFWLISGASHISTAPFRFLYLIHTFKDPPCGSAFNTFTRPPSLRLGREPRFYSRQLRISAFDIRCDSPCHICRSSILLSVQHFLFRTWRPRRLPGWDWRGNLGFLRRYRRPINRRTV